MIVWGLYAVLCVACVCVRPHVCVHTIADKICHVQSARTSDLHTGERSSEEWKSLLDSLSRRVSKALARKCVMMWQMRPKSSPGSLNSPFVIKQTKKSLRLALFCFRVISDGCKLSPLLPPAALIKIIWAINDSTESSKNLNRKSRKIADAASLLPSLLARRETRLIKALHLSPFIV